MRYTKNQKMLIKKFIADMIDLFFDSDTISQFVSASTIESTPIMYCLSNIWCDSQEIDVSESEWYCYSQVFLRFFKSYSNLVANDFFEIEISQELSILNMKHLSSINKLVTLVTFTFIILYGERSIKCLHDFVDMSILYDAQSIIDEQTKIQLSLGG